MKYDTAKLKDPAKLEVDQMVKTFAHATGLSDSKAREKLIERGYGRVWTLAVYKPKGSKPSKPKGSKRAKSHKPKAKPAAPPAPAATVGA